MVKGISEAMAINSFISGSETIPIYRGSIRLDLVLEELSKFLLEIGLCAFLLWWAGGWWRRRRWCWCRCARPGHDLRVQPHVGQHLTDALFNLRSKRSKTYKHESYKLTVYQLISKFIHNSVISTKWQWDSMTTQENLVMNGWLYKWSLMLFLKLTDWLTGEVGIYKKNHWNYAKGSEHRE